MDLGQAGGEEGIEGDQALGVRVVELVGHLLLAEQGRDPGDHAAGAQGAEPGDDVLGDVGQVDADHVALLESVLQ